MSFAVGGLFLDQFDHPTSSLLKHAKIQFDWLLVEMISKSIYLAIKGLNGFNLSISCDNFLVVFI